MELEKRKNEELKRDRAKKEVVREGKGRSKERFRNRAAADLRIFWE
jgi:hypothetical protein